MPTTVDDLNQILQAPKETAGLEFKAAKLQWSQDSLCEYAVAIANEGGGRLILGVADKAPRQIVGTSAFRDPDAVRMKVLQSVNFRVEIDEVEHPAGRVLVIRIPSRPKGTPLQYDGRFLMRVGESLVPMTHDQIRKIIEEGRPDCLSEHATEALPVADALGMLDIQTYYELQERRQPESPNEVVKVLLRDRILATADRNSYVITKLGALLCARHLEAFNDLARKAPRVIVYEGTGKAHTTLDMHTKPGYAIGFQDLVTFVNSHLPQNEIIENALREKVRMVPDVAVREVIANALIHQDFSESGTSVTIEIYSDRLEIKNPGLPIITPERFIDENQSRNERLASLMRRLRICEEKGSGIDRVIQIAELMQLPAPDFRVGEKHTSVVLFGPREIEEMGATDRIRACYQHAALRFVRNQMMTNESLRERFRLPESKAETVSRIIRDTCDAALIKQSNTGSQSKRYRKYVPFWA